MIYRLTGALLQQLQLAQQLRIVAAASWSSRRMKCTHAPPDGEQCILRHKWFLLASDQVLH